MSKPASSSQISYAKHLVKQQKLTSPTAAEVEAMDDVTISKLIDGLKKKRGEPVFYGNGKFKGWAKKGELWPKKESMGMNLFDRVVGAALTEAAIGGRVAGARRPLILPVSQNITTRDMTPELIEKRKRELRQRAEVRERLRQLSIEDRRPLKTLET